MRIHTRIEKCCTGYLKVKEEMEKSQTRKEERCQLRSGDTRVVQRLQGMARSGVVVVQRLRGNARSEAKLAQCLHEKIRSEAMVVRRLLEIIEGQMS